MFTVEKLKDSLFRTCTTQTQCLVVLWLMKKGWCEPRIYGHKVHLYQSIVSIRQQYGLCMPDYSRPCIQVSRRGLVSVESPGVCNS